MKFVFGENYTDGITVISPTYSVFDSDANSSNKVFTVPAGEMWKLNFAHVTLVSSGAAGNRQMEMIVADSSGNVMFTLSAGATQAASLTRDYHFMQGTYRETAFVANELQVPFGNDLSLPAGWTLRFKDSAAIAAAADDMTVAFQVQRFKGC